MPLGSVTEITIKDAGVLPLSDSINVVRGATATLLTRPSGLGIGVLVLQGQAGEFNVRVGDYVSAGMPTTADPGAAITNGSGAIRVHENETLKIAAADEVTVKGYDAADALAYYWI